MHVDQSKGAAAVVAARGGSFLIEDRRPEEIFTPEDLSEEQRLIGRTCEEWIRRDVIPRLAEVHALRYAVIRQLLRKGGELGLLGIEIPEEYGGLGLDKASTAVAAERVTRDGSFAA